MNYKQFYEVWNTKPKFKRNNKLINNKYFDKTDDFFIPNLRETQVRLITSMPINYKKSIDTPRITLLPVNAAYSNIANINNIYLK